MTNEELQYFIKRHSEGVRGNDLKSEIQTFAINKWLRAPYNGKGFIKAYTGFGKSFMTKEIFRRFESKYEYKNKGVIVPNSALHDSFRIIGEELELKNYYPYIINSYVLSDREDIVKNFGLFIVDEIHRVCSEDSEFFKTTIPQTNYELFLGISATLEKKHEEYLKRFGIFEVFEITFEEGIRLGLVEKYTILNVGVDLLPDEKDSFVKNELNFNRSFGYFRDVPQYDSFKLAMACGQKAGTSTKISRSYNGSTYTETRTTDEWASIVANYKGGSNTVKIVKGQSAIFLSSLRKRNSIADYAQNKLIATDTILKGLNSDIYSISFLAKIDQADYLEKHSQNRALAYHSKISKKIRDGRLAAFRNGAFNHLLTIRSVDEGVDFKLPSVAIDYKFYKSPIQTVQRLGRILRVDENNKDKKPYFVFLYCNPFIAITTEEIDKVEFQTPDYKKLLGIQKQLINVKNVTVEECLEIINAK